MTLLSQHTQEGSVRAGVQAAALLSVLSLIAGCESGEGVQLGTGQDPDPVVVDFPIAYIKAPLPVDDQGEFAQTDVRELISFDFGGDVYFRDRASPSALDFNITEAETQGLGAVRDLEIAYDGSSLLFAMRGPVDLNLAIDDEDQPTWNIWEYVFETSELRRVISSALTAEIGHDVAPKYLPDGRIIFSSTRQLRSNAVLLDEGKPQFPAEDEDQNEPAFLLHVMNDDGTGIEQVSFNQSHDFDPSVLSNGQVIFSRWDHAGRNDSVNLYRMNPDGSQLEMLYGQNSHDTGGNGEVIQFTKPREMEDGRILTVVRPFTDTDGGGDLVVIETVVYLENTQPTMDNAGMTGPAQQRATIVNVSTDPGVPSPGGRFSSVYPIQDGTGRMMVSWTQCSLTDVVDPNAPPSTEPVFFYPCTAENLADPLLEAADPTYGVWIYDPRDDTQLPIVAPEQGVMFTEVVSADPRLAPPVILDSENSFTADSDLVAEAAAVLNIRSVYDFDGGAVAAIETLADPAQTTADLRPARFLRVVKAVSIPDDDFLDINNTAFGRDRAQGMKEIVGYSMIEPDGSVMVKVPANVALTVSVLDADGHRITARHQNWIQLRPGQLLECNGCHVANSGISHGRFDAFASAYAGATVAGGPFLPGTDPALFVGDLGETMAEVRARISCATDNCSSLEPSMNVNFDDVWTDEATAGRLKDASFTYAYTDLTTAAPTSLSCITQPWLANCRIVINYEMHIHPLWAALRPVLDALGNPVIDPVTLLPLSNDCVNCHSPVDDQAQVRVPLGQLDLTDGISPDEPDQFNSYRELLFDDDEQEVMNGALVDRLIQVGVDIDGNPIFSTVNVSSSMSAAGANAAGRFFDRFAVNQSHDGYLSDAEKRLLAEWLDVGAQYYNNPFDAPTN